MMHSQSSWKSSVLNVMGTNLPIYSMPEPPGVKGFDFNKKTVVAPDGKNKRINLLALIQHLWPGNWELQLSTLNQRIEESNNNLRSATATFRACRLISPHEFWVFWGLLIVARLEGRKGELWDVSEPLG